MCYFEYNWTACVWQFRVGDRFTDYRGIRSWELLSDIKQMIAQHGLALIRTDSRTYQLVCQTAERAS